MILYVHTLQTMNLKNLKSKCHEHCTRICYMLFKFTEYSNFNIENTITIKIFNF